MGLKNQLENNGSVLSSGLNGKRPTGALKNPSTIGINNTFSLGEYDVYQVQDLSDSNITVDRTLNSVQKNLGQ